MARSFDGTNDEISFGSDASVDDLSPLSFAAWITCTDATDTILDKYTASNAGWQLSAIVTARVFRFRVGAATTPGEWRTSGTFTANVPIHVAVTYDKTSVSNDPTIWLDGTSQSFGTDTNPVGAVGSDAANNLKTGQDQGNGADWQGSMQVLMVTSGTITADQVNRHRWWGRIGGSVAVQHPFFTTKLANEGTATAAGTASGTTVASLPRVQRPCTATMGCGVGW